MKAGIGKRNIDDESITGDSTPDEIYADELQIIPDEVNPDRVKILMTQILSIKKIKNATVEGEQQQDNSVKISHQQSGDTSS